MTLKVPVDVRDLLCLEDDVRAGLQFRAALGHINGEDSPSKKEPKKWTKWETQTWDNVK